jgi:hypothetical protein
MFGAVDDGEIRFVWRVLIRGNQGDDMHFAVLGGRSSGASSNKQPIRPISLSTTVNWSKPRLHVGAIASLVHVHL